MMPQMSLYSDQVRNRGALSGMQMTSGSCSIPCRSDHGRLTLTDAVFHAVVLLGEFVAVVQHELSVEDVDDPANRQVAVIVEVCLPLAHLFTQKRQTAFSSSTPPIFSEYLQFHASFILMSFYSFVSYIAVI